MDFQKIRNKFQLSGDLLNLQKKFFYLSHVYFIYKYYDLTYFKYEVTAYQWPLFWLRFTGVETGLLISSIAITSFFLLGIFFNKYKLIRFLVFLSHLLLASILVIPGFSSNHSTYLYLYVSFALIFIKNDQKDSSKVIPALILMPYFLAGLNKVLNMGVDIFDSTAFNRVLAERYLISGESFFFPSVINIGNWSSVLFSSTVIMQLACVGVIFVPKLYRAFSILLILFHLVSYFFLNIDFIPSIFVLIIFLFFNFSQKES